jgi:hypothetical protein
VVSELFLVKVLDFLDGGVLSLLADASVTDIDALEKLLEDGNGVAVGSRVLLWDSSHHFELLSWSHLLFGNFEEVLGQKVLSHFVHFNRH